MDNLPKDIIYILIIISFIWVILGSTLFPFIENELYVYALRQKQKEESERIQIEKEEAKKESRAKKRKERADINKAKKAAIKRAAESQSKTWTGYYKDS